MTDSDPKDLEMIRKMASDEDFAKLARDLFARTVGYRYSYNFSWLGRPIIQYPEDIVALQEIVWKTKPDVIVETGIAHGGSLIFYASLLALLGGDGTVIGVDVDIRPHNRAAIESHFLAGRIVTIEGSSTDDETVEKVAALVERRGPVMVVLDSNHTAGHVLEELRRYSKFVGKGGYLIVLDTVVDRLPEDSFSDRPWGVGNGPLTAVRQFLRENDRFEVDEEYDKKLTMSVAPGGYLRCVADREVEKT